MLKCIKRLGLLFSVFFSFLFYGCIDPVEPKFEFAEGLIFIDGFASTAPGASFVTISESLVEFGVYAVNSVEGASVNFENVDTGEIVQLIESMGAYQPSIDFVAAPGERWKLSIQLADGKRIESTSEPILNAVPITGLDVNYDPELVFREANGGELVPGHSVTVNFTDPPEEGNYYYWNYRTFENLIFCKKCIEGIFRNGECQPADIPGRGNAYFDYTCEVDCWKIRFPESVAIFNDQFSNGKTITKLPIGDLLLHNKENMVVEVQQFALTPAAYDYYKVLKDIVDNSSGLNAPPPAALVGNLSNLDDDEEYIFGRFTAAATSIASVFIDRSGIKESPIDETQPIVTEPSFPSPYPPPSTYTAPCEESKFRTAFVPKGWIEQ